MVENDNGEVEVPPKAPPVVKKVIVHSTKGRKMVNYLFAEF